MPSVADIFALVAKVPLALIPGVTWAVVTWAALGVYQVLKFKMLPADYIIAPILLTYLIYLSWRRDSWGGVAGSAIGIALALAGGLWFGGVVGNAVGLMWEWFWSAFTSLIGGVLRWLLLAFAFGLVVGFATAAQGFLIIIALAISAVQAFVIYAWLSYFQGLLLASAYRAASKMTHELQAGVHVLAGMGVASTVGMLDVFVTAALILTVLAYTLGLWVGAALMAIFNPLAVITIVADMIMKGVAIAASRLEHMGVVSGTVSVFLFHIFNIASVGLAWLAAVSLIFSRRRGHLAYSAMAAAMLALSLVGWYYRGAG